MEDVLGQVWHILASIVTNLTNPDAWREVLQEPGVFWAALIAVTLIVFTETGLLAGFFLPGDSLLVTVGLVAHLAEANGAPWPLHLLVPTLWAAAVLGDSCGYRIGASVGPRVFQKEDSFFFRKKYLLAAHEFYARHGGKTIVLAKFVPIIRTFAPVVAGAGAMPYRRFLAFSVCGAVGWITSMVVLGYTLHLWLEPLLEKALGRKVEVARNIDKVIVAVILVSVLPIVYKGGKGYLAKRKAARMGATPPAPTA